MKKYFAFWILAAILLLPVLAIADVTMTPLTSGQINTYVGYLGWAKMFGIGGAALASVLTWIASMRGLLGTPAGMADINDIGQIGNALLDLLKNSNHAQKPAVVNGLNVILADAKAAAIPPAPTLGSAPKSVVAILGLLLLSGSIYGSTISLGTPLTPTAAASYIQATVVTAPDLFKLSGGNLTWEPGAFYGGQATYQWGKNYGLGLDVGVNVEGAGTADSPVLGRVAVGGVLDFLQYVLAVNAANDGWHAGITYLWGPQTGASLQVAP